MHELMLLLSNAVPEDFILDEITQAISAYKLSKDKKDRDKISMMCAMLLSKDAIDSNDKGIDGVNAEFERAKQGMELLKPKIN